MGNVVNLPFFFLNWKIIALQRCVGFCCTVMGISHNYTLPREPPSHLCIFLKDKSWVYPHISNSHCALPGFSSLINLASFSCAENLSSQTKYLSDLSDVSFKTQDKTATTTIMKMFLEFCFDLSLQCCCFFFTILFAGVFVAVQAFSSFRVRGLHSSCSALACHWGGFPCGIAQPLGTQASEIAACGLCSTGSAVVAHRPSCPMACGIFLEQGSNLYPLSWQADS